MQSFDFNNCISYWGDLYTWLSIFEQKKVYVFENKPYCEFPRGFLNRTKIVSSQGIQQLSIPIQGGRKNKIIFKDIKIDYSENWQKNHYRSIQSCYGKSPWWEEYKEEIQKIYEQKKEFLLEWNMLIYEWTAHILDFHFAYISSSSHLCNSYKKHSIISYQQVFGERFYDNVFILDAILCQGEKSLKNYLLNI